MPTETLDIADPTPSEMRDFKDITPPLIFDELNRGVLGQDRALRFVSVAVYKHTTGKVSGNLLMIGNSGTGKTTIMNNLQRLYNEVPEYRPFRAVTIINANLLVDADRLEFRPDRLMSAVEQRARAIVGARPTPEELTTAIQRATICIDEIDKMSTILAGKPNALGVVLQQGLLTLMEGERITYPTHAWVDGVEKEVKLDIDTGRMMFICGGAFESLYEQVLDRVSRPGGGSKLKTQTIRTAEGQMRIETRFLLSEQLKPEDLFKFGMVPQFMARFEKVVVLADLSQAVLQEILLKSFDSPYVRARAFFKIMDIHLDIEALASALISEKAGQDRRTGARALRPIFTEIINPLEFDPWNKEDLVAREEGGWNLLITSDMVRKVISGNS
ncbi:MAG: AAA family ATPase [Deltaproteobacteria bacterium]|nr:AAA family ATPase [Deltaproteobacteria bacterium]